MKFQDSNMRGSKVTEGIIKCDEHTNRQAKGNMPHQRFQSWGHIKENNDLSGMPQSNIASFVWHKEKE